MMSAHEVAVAALNEVAATARSESHSDSTIKESDIPLSTVSPTAASLPSSTLPIAVDPEVQHSNDPHFIQSSSSTNSQSTIPDAITPLTSDSVTSQSQDLLSQLSQLAATRARLVHVGGSEKQPLSVATNAGQKRSIDGYVKPSGSSSSGSPKGYGKGHSRNTSNISTASSAVSSRELTSELRARLSYAMVKVSKGWESLPIDEVESLASQAGSPTSSSSTLHGRRNILTSPRTAIASMQGQSSASQYSNMPGISNSHNDSVIFTDGQPSRTYESFWREQSQRHVGLSAHISSPPSSTLSLAPSAELSSRPNYTLNPRRFQPSKFSTPPMLEPHTTSDFSQQSTAPVAPNTPGRTSHPSDKMLQTPTQKSLQEQDAIETLLFMSSPGNSSSMGHAFPPSQGIIPQLRSPLQADFGAPLHRAEDRNMDFTRIPSTRSSDSGSGPVTSRILREQETLVRSAVNGVDHIDHMLDTMADDESSDDEIEIIITPRRLTSGRA